MPYAKPMAYSADYLRSDPSRAEVGGLTGATVIEFGSPWCGHCRRAEPAIRQAFETHPAIRHIKVADASGKRLGRSFRVKLWPTLVFLKDGAEVRRLVRPSSADEVQKAMDALDS